ncbi:MAG: hypothetical protein MN733_25545, partial [Nitrososphaera sp.]|nr:hypothetical protein [Nitrososphaera sp.]
RCRGNGGGKPSGTGVAMRTTRGCGAHICTSAPPSPDARAGSTACDPCRGTSRRTYTLAFFDETY